MNDDTIYLNLNNSLKTGAMEKGFSSLSPNWLEINEVCLVHISLDFFKKRNPTDRKEQLS